MKALVKTYLNVRTGSPRILPNNNPGTYYGPGDEIEIAETVIGDNYKGIRIWYKLTNHTYVWSGGVEETANKKIAEQYEDQSFDINKYWWLKDYKIDELWAQGLSGAGVKIAVLDTGVYLHPDLDIDLKNCGNSAGGTSVLDQDGHGTHCIGIIKAQGIVKGIAYNSTIYSCKVCTESNDDDIYYLKQGIEWAISKDVEIISISKGFAADYLQIESTIQKAKANNILVVCAGGNNIKDEKQNEIYYPAYYDSVLSVGAVDMDKKVPLVTITSNRLKLLAPGVNINSTSINGKYKEETGSSQAAPYVAGVAALIIEYINKKGRTYSVKDLERLLINSAEKVSGYNARIVNPINAIHQLKA